MADDALFEAKVRLRPELDRAATEAQVKQGLEGAAKAAASAIAALGLGKVIADSFTAGLDELKQQQGVIAQTEARLRSTGGAANVSAAEVAALASSLQDLSGKDAEAIQGAENLLLTFKSIRNEGTDRIFDDTTRAALDLSVAFGMDLNSAALMVGKALEDPVRGITALRRAGVSFTQDQRDLIKSLVETGRQAEAQKLILKELESQVGGSAKAYGETLAGRMERAKNAMDDAKASIVAGLAPALEDLSAFAVSASDAFQSLPQPVQTLSAAVVAGTVAFKFAQPAVSALRASLAEAGGAAAAANAAFGPLAITAAALGSVFLTYQSTVDGSVRGLKGFLSEAEKAAKNKSLPELRDQISRMRDATKDLEAQSKTWNPVEADQMRQGAKATRETADALQAYADKIGFIMARTGESEEAIRGWLSTQDNLGAGLKDNQAALDAFNTAKARGQLDNLAGSADQAEKELSQTKQAVDRLFDLQLAMADGEANIADAKQRVADAAAKANREGWNTENTEAYERAQRDLEKAIVDQARNVSEYNTKLAEANNNEFSVGEQVRVMREKIEAEIAKIGPGSKVANDLAAYLSLLKAIEDKETARAQAEQQRQSAPPAATDYNTPGSPNYGRYDPYSDPTNPLYGTRPPQIMAAPGRAGGGSLTPGVPTLVGEHGPEVVTAPGTGYSVSPNMGGGPMIVMNVHGTANAEEAATRAAYKIGRALTGRLT